MVFILTKDYHINETPITKGTLLKVSEYEVLDLNGDWIFDVDSPIANEYGYILSY